MNLAIHGRWSSRLVMFVLAATTLGSAGGTLSAQTACGPLADAFNTATSNADFKAMVDDARRLLDADSCPASTRAEVGRKVALAYVREAGRIPDSPLAAAARLKLLEVGMRFGQPWQLMAMIGDLRQEVPNSSGQIDFKAASLAYQAALSDVENTSSAPNAPPRAEIERLTHLAQQTRMVASDFVPGDVLMTRAMRGVTIEAVPVPIQFVYGSREMTPLGREYAEDMLKVLNEQGRPRILLVGHTDPIGSDESNLELSLRRADAVKGYLEERNYPRGAIEVDGRGRRDPLRVENEGQYSLQQIYQMQRRVEVKFR